MDEDENSLYTPDFLGAYYFYAQDELLTRDGLVSSVELYEVGSLCVTSGKIVACDGLIPSTEPFTETIKIGHYPIILSLVLNHRPWPIVACAMLRLKDEMPTAWKPAVISTGNQSVQSGVAASEYGVDTGMGCFADLDVMQTLIASPHIYANLQDCVNQPDTQWLDFQLDAADPTNIIVFSSGEGDGSYPSYFGYNVAGEILCIATDFGIFAPLLGPPEAPHKDQLRLDF